MSSSRADRRATWLVLISLVAGLLLGALSARLGDGVREPLITTASLIGGLWLDALKMTVIPLIIALLITGIVSGTDHAKAGGIAGRSFLWFAGVLTASAIFGALATPALLEAFPLSSASAEALRAGLATVDAQAAAASVPTISDWLKSLIPTNPIAAAAEDKVLALVVFTPAAASMQERIRAVLEEEIVSGTRPPGSAIDEKALADRFGASRTPVREALLVLSTQGLVQIAPRAGIYVRKASTGELVATLEALTELEAALARLAARRASTVQCRELRRAQAQASTRARAEDRPGYQVANAALHEAIYQSSGNPVLVAQVRAVRKTLAAYRQRGFDKPGRLRASDREHARIVKAICEGDDAVAAEAMRSHIQAGGEAMVALVLASEGVPVPEAASR